MTEAPKPQRGDRSANKDWLRALQQTAAIEQDPHRILPRAFDEIARERGAAPALIGEKETLSFTALSERANRWARWAQTQGLRKGDAVCLMLENQPDYAALWLGLTRVGVVVALVNTNLAGTALAHCVEISGARLVIVSRTLFGACTHALADRPRDILQLAHEDALDTVKNTPAGPLDDAPVVTLDDCALYIYTSGTTGLPKAAIVSHRRLMNWALWFRGLLDIGADDRMYNCLPMYHSIGGVVAIFAPLLGGGSAVVRERFSASAFWDDIVANDCTLFQYIGELCRYLVNSEPRAAETKHRLRLCVGNGLQRDVWERFQQRFAIPRIVEFYAATESNFSLYNVEDEPGAIGRIPGFLAQKQQLALVRYDDDGEQPARDAAGRCQRCGVDETGEAIARIDPRSARFDGYIGAAESQRKILRDVFEPGDAWMRSGDLMRKDARGFFYFVDRVGDTFRWKGENVATTEVAQALAACPGVRDATVYGVAVPGHEGRAGMAALVCDDALDLAQLRRHIEALAPEYARPLFLRLQTTLATTETFKHKKRALAEEGFDPGQIVDALYFAEPGRAGYTRVDAALYTQIIAGAHRL